MNLILSMFIRVSIVLLNVPTVRHSSSFPLVDTSHFDLHTASMKRIRNMKRYTAYCSEATTCNV